ncbi:MAG: PleD family two-component system response regulator [Rhodospirillales bacterium RIFCSPLOWO2_12_FULL_58_28]|nr:MAG: PleD family two-component system response regulator [Rhodospirillales bacterium RIFCSPLOWO2_02_FULL_58_16]OHC77449.1 MAG: PleD family two-component system response regulator [Rhodospirillales bacterium RIFCSPLOWO2_12_FULL_58_28]
MSARILVVDDIFTSVKVLAAKLNGAYYEVLTAGSGAEALKIVNEHDPDLVLLDVMMPGMDGFDVCRRIKANPKTSHIPVVMVTALSKTIDRVKGLDCGADDFLTKPVGDARLFARIGSLVRVKQVLDQWRMREETTRDLGFPSTNGHMPGDIGGAHIVLVDSGSVQTANIKDALEKDSHRVTVVADAKDVADKVAEAGAEVLIVSVSADGEAPLRLASQLRSRTETRLLPIILIGDEENIGLLIKAMELGVNDYLSRPLDHQELLARVRTQVRRKRYQDCLHDNFLHTVSLALIDGLTGLHNRRYLSTHLDAVMRRMADSGKPVSLMMIDIDHFKQVNDQHGHGAGDEVLCEVASRIANNIRGFHMAARYGGEEFVVVMPDTSIDTAFTVAERLRETIAESAFETKSEKGAANITVSIGISETRDRTCTPKGLLERADQALYKAKEQGRNRVVMES